MKEDILKELSLRIRIDCGSLDFLGHDLANTIANIYYKFMVFCPDEVKDLTQLCKNGTFDHIEREYYGHITFPIRLEIMKRYCVECYGVDDSLTSEYAFLSASIIEIPALVKQLKEAQLTVFEKDFAFSTEIFLYVLKFRIIDAMSKSILRLRVEAKFIKPPISEIKNLASLLSAYDDLPF
jgi:hypothetical protein